MMYIWRDGMKYFGDASLCYSNSLLMLLESYGYEYTIEYIEAIMSMGNGATLVNDDLQHPLVYFDNGLPDKSISNTLDILGYGYKEYYLEDIENFVLDEVIQKLNKYLENGSVIAGPIDMGYLKYNPNHSNLLGVDHFVCITKFVESSIYLHDPAGFPFMKVPLKEFIKSWEAKNIEYKRGSFSMWGNLKKESEPCDRKIYNSAISIIKTRYMHSEENVIENYAEAIFQNGLNEMQEEMHKYFSFRLASVRNLYISNFLRDFDKEKALIKEKIAINFSKAHIESVNKEFKKLSNTLKEISILDNKFKQLCINYEG
ncbi:DNA repair protein RadC [Macrococcoides caseolyticum]|uniref:DNA repair protein RadC n=2 Tax=Macrococcoides caseolyticum TaxID=69966 RepID=A0A855H190_9STAP|nr:DNA repair protein RadC [Macrococcus caseolyticus]PKE57771.1 DNA repair protein RadC [Macrococcus caseolyticus]